MAHRKRNGEGTIVRLKDGAYVARMMQGTKPNGSPYVKSRRAKTKKEAQEKLKEIKAEFEREKQEGALASSTITVSKYFDNFLEFKKSAIGDLSYRRLESTVNTHIKPYFDYYRFNELTGDMIQARLNNAHQNGLSHSSVKKIYEAFNGCYKYAISRGDVLPQNNPMLSVNMITASKFIQSSNEPRYLSGDADNNERQRFMDEALRKYKNGSYVYRYGTALIFMLQTGLRESEMCALKHEHIDLNKNIAQVYDSAATVKIGDHYKTVIRENQTKWNSGRYVPLNKTALTMVDEMSKVFGNKGLIIRTVHDTVLPPLELTKTFNRICQAAGITENMEGVGAHCLRHTFATAMFEHGVDVKVISEILGHTNTNVTLNTYISVINKLKIEAVNLPTIEI